MKKLMVLFIFMMIGMILLSGCHKNVSQLAGPKDGDTVAEIVVTGYGTMYVRLFDKEAPKAVENFITHAKKGYYDGQSFYRIIEGSLIESGDPTKTGTGGESIWGEDFQDEFNPDLQPYYGALCMANSGPDTNSSEFFIVQSRHTYTDKVLDQIEKSYDIKLSDRARRIYGLRGGAPWFYQRNTIFGQVYEGFRILEKIAKVDKTDKEQGIPSEEVLIRKITITNYKR